MCVLKRGGSQTFIADLTTFVDSLSGGNVDSQVLLGHASGFLESGDETHAYVSAAAAFLRKH